MFGFLYCWFESWLVYKSAVKKTQHCITCSFLYPLVMRREKERERRRAMAPYPRIIVPQRLLDGYYVFGTGWRDYLNPY